MSLEKGTDRARRDRWADLPLTCAPVPAAETTPGRDFSPTESGAALGPALKELGKWAETHLPEGGSCGEATGC